MMRRARGFIDLVFDVVEETTGLVERTHDAVVERSVRRFATIEPARSTARVVTGIQTAVSGVVFGSIRAVNRITRAAVDTVADVAEVGLARLSYADGLDLATPVRSSAVGSASWCVDYLESALNGFWGDHLSRRSSRLDLDMTLRHHGRQLPVTREAFATAFPDPTGRVCVFVHSLAATEWLWSLSSQEHYGDPDVTFGTRLRDDLGFTPIYLRYNTGRHISQNGRALAKLLSEVREAYPVPIEEIVLVGHSMGGLVVRSAAHYARERDEPWVAAPPSRRVHRRAASRRTAREGREPAHGGVEKRRGSRRTGSGGAAGYPQRRCQGPALRLHRGRGMGRTRSR